MLTRGWKVNQHCAVSQKVVISREPLQRDHTTEIWLLCVSQLNLQHALLIPCGVPSVCQQGINKLIFFYCWLLPRAVPGLALLTILTWAGLHLNH